MIAAVAAVDRKFAIGNNGGMLISIPEDLKMFRELTMGQVVIMGRKTFDALPNGPLPGRENVVISSRAGNGFYQEMHRNGRTYYITGMNLVQQWLNQNAARHPLHHFIIGGGQIYEELLPWCERLYLTHIDEAFLAVDTYFPRIDLNKWQVIDQSETKQTDKVTYRFCAYERKATE